MPRVLHYKAPSSGGVFLATPAYSGLSASYTYALFASQQALLDEGISAHFEIMAENCHVDDSRNVLVRDFLETDCESLIFLDADLRWNPSELVKLINHDKDIVAGIYPLKEDEENYPVRLFEGNIVAHNDLVEVEAVPTGFLKIKRHVLQKLHDNSQKFYGKADIKGRLPIGLIFERTMNEGARWGGDYTFCKKAAKEGFKIYIDPEMTFEHAGEAHWNGCYGDYLRKENSIDNPLLIEAFKRLQSGEHDDDVFADLFKGWGNQWAASPELLLTSYELAKEHEYIFECGSGLSTIVMGMTGNHVQALESDYLWYKKTRRYLDMFNLTNVNLQYTGIVDYGDYEWYDIENIFIPEFTLALVDGPVRAIGREGFYNLLNTDNVTLIIDDSDTEALPKDKTINQFCERRPFAVARNLCKSA